LPFATSLTPAVNSPVMPLGFLYLIAAERTPSQSIINTAKKVKEMKFNMEIEMKQLSKTTLDKEHKIMIYRILNKDVGEGWKYKKINKNTKEITEEYWLNKIPDYLVLSDFYKKSEIKENEYMLYDNIVRMVYKITDEEYLQYDYKGNINKRIKK
jgi:hypothetical protein